MQLVQIGLKHQYGIRDGQYFLTETFAQAILELRLHLA